MTQYCPGDLVEQEEEEVEGYFTTFSGDAVADRVMRDILTTFSGDAVADRVGEIFLQPSQATQWRIGWGP